MTITWKTGFEIELLAPVGKSRRDLAVAVAKQCKGKVNQIFYPQSEPSKVPGMPVFESLTLGFEVLDFQGSLIATFVDDLTIRKDLDHKKTSKPGWYRIVSDDGRFLRLIQNNCDATNSRETVLGPLANLFGTKILAEKGGFYQVLDGYGESVAMAAKLPGERERPCELITPPIDRDHCDKLDKLLNLAKDLGFTIPLEAAVHIHFDATQLHNTKRFCRLLEVIKIHAKPLKNLVGFNKNCTRAGPLPAELFKLTSSDGFSSLNWQDASKQIKNLKLTKYYDFNIINLIHDIPGKNTFEVRIFPGSLETKKILQNTLLFQNILDWCCDNSSDKIPEVFEDFLQVVNRPD